MQQLFPKPNSNYPPASFRMNRPKLCSYCWLLIALSFSPINYAQAYLDPGTGSYAIQIAIGIIFGATYTLKTFGSRLINRLKTRRRKSNVEA